MKGVKGIGKILVEPGHLRGVCDFCHKKGKSYRLRSSYRNYRFLVVCPECLRKLRSGFNREKV